MGRVRVSIAMLSLSRAAVRAQCSLKHAASVQQVRNFNIHEYQSKILCDQHGVTVQKWRCGSTPAECQAGAEELAKEMKGDEIVIKAQVHAGGRGKGHFIENGYKGGVQFTTKAGEVPGIVENMLGNHLWTNQTPEEGVLVRQVMVAESVHITPINISTGITKEQCDSIAKQLEFEPKFQEEAAVMINILYNLFIATDAVQVELNPIAETKDHGVVCVDAKLGFDDNALYRQEQVVSFRDPTEEDPREVEADKAGLNYIGLDGNIACLVNGAGLAMATMDIIKLKGGDPANFLDVGGSATEEQVAEAFKILTADPKREAILVNIFGGIMKCDVIAQGIVNAAKIVGLKVPLIVRLEGTNVDMGKKIISESGLAITPANDLDDAAIKAVASTQ